MKRQWLKTAAVLPDPFYTVVIKRENGEEWTAYRPSNEEYFVTNGKPAYKVRDAVEWRYPLVNEISPATGESRQASLDAQDDPSGNSKSGNS